MAVGSADSRNAAAGKANGVEGGVPLPLPQDVNDSMVTIGNAHHCSLVGRDVECRKSAGGSKIVWEGTFSMS